MLIDIDNLTLVLTERSLCWRGYGFQQKWGIHYASSTGRCLIIAVLYSTDPSEHGLPLDVADKENFISTLKSFWYIFCKSQTPLIYPILGNTTYFWFFKKTVFPVFAVLDYFKHCVKNQCKINWIFPEKICDFQLYIWKLRVLLHLGSYFDISLGNYMLSVDASSNTAIRYTSS